MRQSFVLTFSKIEGGKLKEGLQEATDVQQTRSSIDYSTEVDHNKHA